MKQQQQRTSVNNDRTGHSRYLMVYGIIGYFLCFIGDMLLEYLPNGELTWESISNFEMFKEATKGATAQRFGISGVLGISSMIFVTLGLVGISEYVNMYSKIASEIMLVGGVGSSVLSGGFHLICTLVAWIFVSLNSTKEAFEVKDQFYKDHQLILQINPIFYMLFCFTLLYVIVAGKTPLPRWACIFNIAFIFKALDYFKVHGASNIAGTLMCISLFILTGIYSSKSKNNKKKE
ncbi:hypothetical protein BCR32DRAFT_326891 [Anaeromyces robustus]|uniref:Uncharacterized protein n=1 Tax=Anaeromyces robustus TaxID=1754192 RepID=A0A1Y1X9A4_9FUNG|nr:hypothetical protein BCR32DRAFT_326891 [Anaeromyces robustus]|eukprot:ORX82327.1 hypothetical protein BCR32DRAFT_326891 [Anaeromyces robustus]